MECNDCLYYIFGFLDEATHKNIRMVCKNWYNISKASVKINITDDDSDTLVESYCKENKIFHLHELLKIRYLDLNRSLYIACFYGSIDCAICILNKGANNLDCGLEGACSGGQIETIKLMIEKGAKDYDRGLYYACKYNKLNAILYMLENGATNLNHGLLGACTGGHENIVDLMIEKGANDLNAGLTSSCLWNNNLSNSIIKKGAKYCYHCRNSRHEIF